MSWFQLSPNLISLNKKNWTFVNLNSGHGNCFPPPPPNFNYNCSLVIVFLFTSISQHKREHSFCDNNILVFLILNLLDLKSGLAGLEVLALKYYLMSGLGDFWENSFHLFLHCFPFRKAEPGIKAVKAAERKRAQHFLRLDLDVVTIICKEEINVLMCHVLCGNGSSWNLQDLFLRKYE